MIGDFSSAPALPCRLGVGRRRRRFKVNPKKDRGLPIRSAVLGTPERTADKSFARRYRTGRSLAAGNAAMTALQEQEPARSSHHCSLVLLEPINLGKDEDRSQ
jgi:hypothetical protein